MLARLLLVPLLTACLAGTARADTDPPDTDSDAPADTPPSDETYPTGGTTVACDTSSGAPLGLVAIVAGLALARRRVRRALPVLLAALLIAPAGARAQSVDGKPLFAPRLDVQRFEPCGLVGGFAVTCTARQLRKGEVSFDGLFSWAWRPLQRSERIADTLIRREAAIEHLGAAHLRLAMGATDWFQIALGGPVAQIVDARSGLDTFGGPRTANPVAAGDLGFDLAFRPVAEDKGVGLAITLFATFPTGSRRYLLTDGTFGFGGRVAISGQVSVVHLAAHAGYLVKLGGDTVASHVAVDDEVRYGAGIGFYLVPSTLRFDLEVLGASTVGPARLLVDRTPATEKLHTAAEADASFLVTLEDGFALIVGGGTGFTPAPGVPSARAFLGLGYVPSQPRDRDGDGILDRDDACPTDPEDLDGVDDDDGCPDLDDDGDGLIGDDDLCPFVPEDLDLFEDEDGCPDTDDDHDGIPDAADDCPLLPEDRDGYEDEDGCPDSDDDGDGIPDTDDLCPRVPEDPDGVDDEDGCPDGDDDGDGIPDARDLCPSVPETRNGIDDEDGCPDGVGDVDGDGLLDDVDLCPAAPEDHDGFHDDDGCPDGDNDGDGILDADDACPDEAEVRNGVDDADGCPDEGKARLTDDRIEILERVLFYVDEARIRPESYGVLDAVVSILQQYPSIKRVRIEGHTDAQGSDAYNQDLSERRALAVRQYLVDHGVSPTRLLSQGFGERYPVAPNDSEDGRARNRRVEFVILGPGDEGGL